PLTDTAPTHTHPPSLHDALPIFTDNNNRTAPEIRVLFKKGGQLGAPGSNKFLFDHAGLVDAHHPDANADIEAAAIEANAQNVERSEEHTSELQSPYDLVCRLLLE